MDGTKREEASRDRIAFVALIGFATVIYALPGEWIAQLAPLRLALLTSGLAAAAMLVRRLFRGEPLVLDGVRGMSLIALALLALASTTWAINLQVARFTSIELLKMVALYLTLVNVVNTPARFRGICLTLVIASMIASIGVIQWFLRGADLVEGFRSRWLGVYADPNHMAMDLGLVVPLALSFVTRRTQKPLIRILAAIAGILAVTALVLSHSRGGFIGLCVALVLWMFLSNQRIQAGVVAALLAIGLALFAPKSFWVTAFHEDASAMGRVYAWKVRSEMSMDKPLLGVGAGGFRYAWPLYAPPEAKRAYVAHNIFLNVLGELGLVGLVFFLLFVGGAAGGAFAAARSGKLEGFGAAIAASVAGGLVCDFFSGYVLSPHSYVLFGLAACAHRIVRAAGSEPLAHAQPVSSPILPTVAKA